MQILEAKPSQDSVSVVLGTGALFSSVLTGSSSTSKPSSSLSLLLEIPWK